MTFGNTQNFKGTCLEGARTLGATRLVKDFGSLCAFKYKFIFKVDFNRPIYHCRYVQDLIKRNGESVAKLIADGAHIYIAGNAKDMPTAVKEAFANSVATQKKESLEEAMKSIEAMEQNGKYQTETWT